MFDTAYGHITARGQDRRTIFYDERDTRRFMAHLATAVERYDVTCHSYCLMPNHFHLLLEAGADGCGPAMKMLNGAYARYFNWRYGRTGHLFERKYNLEPVGREEHFLECHRYIAMNPVRAGLCREPGDWPWSSYRAVVGTARPPDWFDAVGVAELFRPYGGFANFCNQIAAELQSDCTD